MQRRLTIVTVIALLLVVIGGAMTTMSRNTYNDAYMSVNKNLHDLTPEEGSEQCETTLPPFLLEDEPAFDEVDIEACMPLNKPIAPAKRLVNVGIMTLILLIGGVLFHSRRRYRWHFLLMTVAAIYFGFLNHGCICPVGATGHVANTLVHAREARLSTEAVLLFFIPLITALFFGRIFCGSACPLGALQEIVGRWQTNLPKPVTKILGFGRVLFLVWVVVGAIMYMSLPVCQYDPFVKIFRLSGDTAGWLYAGGFLVLSMTVKRPFCRFICPYAILLGIFAKMGFKTRRIVEDKCISCNKCVKACPVECISLPGIDNFNCVCCGKCSQICPLNAIK